MPPDKQGHIIDLFLPMLLLGERRENILDLFVFVRSFDGDSYHILVSI